MNSKPYVSVIVPCRNEKAFIKKCLLSIVKNDYPHDRLEILVVDGMSEDGTRDIIDTYVKRYPFISRIDNEKKIIPCGMNLGIAHAKGNIFIKMDAHSTYEKNYISRCVSYLQTYNVDNVGGIVVPRPGDNSLRARAIALSLSHPFGVGTSPFRRMVSSIEPRLVDTVAFGCYKREVFKRIGPYNESLIRSSDMELNLRLSRAGGKILLVPDIIAHYYADTTLHSFWKHNVSDGIWAVLPTRYTKTPLSFRHYMPLGLISILLLLLVLSFAHALLFSILISILILYFGVGIIVALSVAIREKDIRYVFFMPVVFAIRHFAYGLGSLWGLVKLAF